MKKVTSWQEKMVVYILKKYLIIILLLGIIFGSAAVAGVRYLKTPAYEATGQLVQHDSNYDLISSYGQFFNSQEFKARIKEKVRQSKWKNYSKKDDYTIKVVSTTSSAFFAIQSTSNEAGYSEFLTDNAMSILTSSIGKYLSGSNISIVSKVKSTHIVSEKKVFLVVGGLAFFIVILVGFVTLFFRELLVGNIRDPYFLENVLDIKNLGKIDVNLKKEVQDE